MEKEDVVSATAQGIAIGVGILVGSILGIILSGIIIRYVFVPLFSLIF